MKKFKKWLKLIKMFLQKPDLLDIELGCYIEQARDEWEKEEVRLELKKEIDEIDMECRRRFSHEDYILIQNYIDLLEDYRIWHGSYMYETALNDYKKIVKEYRTKF